MWAQLGGLYEGRTVGSVLGKSVLFGAVGIAYLLIFNHWLLKRQSTDQETASSEGPES